MTGTDFSSFNDMCGGDVACWVSSAARPAAFAPQP